MSEKVIASLLFLAWVFWMVRLWQKWQDETYRRRVEEYKRLKGALADLDAAAAEANRKWLRTTLRPLK
jgi:hypothetical protein